MKVHVLIIAGAILGGCNIDDGSVGATEDFANERERSPDAITPYAVWAHGGKYFHDPCGFGDTCDPYFRLTGDGEVFTSAHVDDEALMFQIDQPMLDASGRPMVATMADLIGPWTLEVLDADYNEPDLILSCTFDVAIGTPLFNLIEQHGQFYLDSNRASCNEPAALFLQLRSVEPVSLSVDNRCESLLSLEVKSIGRAASYELGLGHAEIEAYVFDEVVAFYRTDEKRYASATSVKPTTREIIVTESCIPEAR